MLIAFKLPTLSSRLSIQGTRGFCKLSSKQVFYVGTNSTAKRRKLAPL